LSRRNSSPFYRDVGFVIDVSDDDLGPVTDDVRDAQADGADERSGIHAKSHFVRRACVQEMATLSRAPVEWRRQPARCAGICRHAEPCIGSGAAACGIWAPPPLSKKTNSSLNVQGGVVLTDPRDGKLAHAASVVP